MIAIEAQDWGSNSKAPFRIAVLRMVLSSSAEAGPGAAAGATTALGIAAVATAA